MNTHFINWPFTRECPFYKLWFRLQVEQVRYPRAKGPITYTYAYKTKGFLELSSFISAAKSKTASGRLSFLRATGGELKSKIM